MATKPWMTVFTRIELLVSSPVYLQLDRKKVHDRNSADAKLSVDHKNKITKVRGRCCWLQDFAPQQASIMFSSPVLKQTITTTGGCGLGKQQETAEDPV